MVINMELAEERGLSKETITLIGDCQNQLTDIIEKRVGQGFSKEIYNYIEQREYELQALWGFSQDSSYHTWKKRYEFKCQWANRTFRCKDTGVEFTIPECVEEGAFFIIGQGFLDVGRLNDYSRRGGNLEEVKSEG